MIKKILLFNFIAVCGLTNVASASENYEVQKYVEYERARCPTTLTGPGYHNDINTNYIISKKNIENIYENGNIIKENISSPEKVNEYCTQQVIHYEFCEHNLGHFKLLTYKYEKDEKVQYIPKEEMIELKDFCKDTAIINSNKEWLNNREEWLKNNYLHGTFIDTLIKNEGVKKTFEIIDHDYVSWDINYNDMYKNKGNSLYILLDRNYRGMHFKIESKEGHPLIFNFNHGMLKVSVNHEYPEGVMKHPRELIRKDYEVKSPKYSGTLIIKNGDHIEEIKYENLWQEITLKTELTEKF